MREVLIKYFTSIGERQFEGGALSSKYGILKNKFLHKSFQRILFIVKAFERNILTVFCKFFLLKNYILNIAILSVIIKCHWLNFLWKIYVGAKLEN